MTESTSQNLRETTLAERERRAAENMDWDLVLNGDPPCFHLHEQGFCRRAKRWAGHANGVAKANRDGCAHEFVSLADLLAVCANEALERAEKCAESQPLGTGPLGVAAAIRKLKAEG